MAIKTWDAQPVGSVPGATLFQLNVQRNEEGELCLYSDYARLKEEFMDYVVRKEKELNTLALAYKNLTDKNN